MPAVKPLPGAWRCPFCALQKSPERLGDDYLRGIGQVHEWLIEAANAKRTPGQALIAISHAHMAGGSVSEDSERSLIIGNAEGPARQPVRAEHQLRCPGPFAQTTTGQRRGADPLLRLTDSVVIL